VQRRDLAEIIEARAEEIYQLVLQEIKRSGYDGLLPAGVVMTGGTSQLRGLRELGRHVLSLPVRVGMPQNLQGLTDAIDSPAYATSVGLLLWGRDQSGTQPLPVRKDKKGSDWSDRFGGFIKTLLPDRIG
jgi:cell division protein FtsA